MTLRQRLVITLCFLLIAYLATGCTASKLKPYVEVGLGHTVNRDPLVPQRLYGRDPTAHIAVGVDYKWVDKRAWYVQTLCQYDHWSHLRDGWPFNNNPETHKDEIMCGFRVGGQ